MKRNYLYKLLTIAVLCGTLLLPGCSAGTSESAETGENSQSSTSIDKEQNPETDKGTNEIADQAKEGKIEEVRIDSECIAKNKLNHIYKRKIYIYLPPSYCEGDKCYPVVYFLQGYGNNSKTFANSLKGHLDVSFNSGHNEFIFVVYDGNTMSGGSFYVNSTATGDWGDFVSEEVVDYLDTNYRTIADRESRCISGYSMGGYGAINAALTRSDVFGSLLVFCPGIYADGDIQAMWDSWNGANDVKLSYGQAFSPNDDPDKNFADIPDFSGTEEDNAIIDRWDKGYGNWEYKIKQFAESGTPLSGIQINYGSLDNYTWIPGGCRFFSEKLSENGIENELTEFRLGHVVPPNCISDYYIPFCEENLKFED